MVALFRSAQLQLAEWLDAARRKPLVIRGARQVGKSTVVRQLAAARGMPLLEVNLEQHRRLDTVFATLNVKSILLELEAVGRATPTPGTLLFLDEIQATPSALAALRYLYEARPDLPVIAAGSLLEFVLQTADFSMPVGRIEYLHLGPLTFREFLHAVGEADLVEFGARWNPNDPWADAAHQRLAARLREFLLVGGMPEAVAVHAEGHGMDAVRRVQRSIVSTYRDDFAKYSSTSASLLRLQAVFDFVPTALGQKIKYVNISREQKSRELRSALELLALARVVWPVNHSDSSGVPLGAQIDPHVYKCLFLDVGLASHMTGVDLSTLGKWNLRQLVHEGGLAEQFVGQHLLFRKDGLEVPTLHYWLREGRSTNAEVDFVIEHGRSVVPVEVKAGTTGGLRSLQQFFARSLTSDHRIALRLDLNPPSLSEHEHRRPGGQSVRYQLLSLPLFMVEESERLLRKVLG